MKRLRGVGADSRDALILTIGRTTGFVFAFAIPLVLVRVLDQEAFGTYKYLFLIGMTLAVLQLGLAESLYYFVPRARDEAGRVIGNAVALLFGIGAVLVTVVAVWQTQIVAFTGATDVGPYLPQLSWFLAGVLVSMPLEIVMVARRRYRTAAITYAASDACRALLLIVPGVMAQSLTAVMAGAAIFGLLRIVAAAAYLAREFGRHLQPDRVWARAQLAYALPFSVAVIIETLQLNLHQFVVWRRFDPTTFAVYAAGCLQIPIVDLLATSVGNVMMVRMAGHEASAAEMLRLWQQAVLRLGRILLPLAVALLLTASDLIVVLFTAAYAASVPIFMMSTVTVALATLPVDSVLRAWAQTRFLIVMNLVRLGVVLAGISWALGTFGLIGGVLITAVGLATSKVVAVVRIARTLDVGLAQVLPWRALGIIAATAGLAALPVLAVVPYLPAVPLLRGALTTGLYALTFIGLTAAVPSGMRRAITAPDRPSGEAHL